MSELNDFDMLTEKEEIPVSELDEAFIAVRKAEDFYEEKRKESSEANAIYVDAKEKFISLLKRTGKTRWDSPSEDYSGFSIYDELRFRVPQSMECKKNFLGFLTSDKVSSLLEQSPDDIFYTYVTVNANSLNSLCKKISELSADNGEQIEIPGIMAPQSETKLRSLPKRRK